MDIKERFDLIIKELYNNNQRAFAKAIGVTPSVVANVVGSRKGKPSFEVLVKVCANADISPAWIILGEGGMRKTSSTVGGILPDGEPSPDNKDKQIILEKQENPAIISQLLDTIREQAEEIGKLKVLIAELEKRICSADDAHTTATAG